MVAGKKVNFRFGDIVQLEDTSRPGQHYRVQVVGVLPGLSLLVTAPEVRGQLVPLDDGNRFNVRIFDGDDALAFPSRLIRYCREPYAYLHLQYPERIDWVQARNARRARLKLSAQVRVTRSGAPDDPFALEQEIGPQQAAVIRDISTAGAQLETAAELGDVGTRLAIMTTLAFDRMAGRSVVLPAEIRNVKRMVGDDGGVLHYFGVQFIDLPVEADLALSAFVYRHLASQLLPDAASA